MSIYKNERVIDCFDLDNLVQKTYNKKYCFQQQDGCKSRGREYFTVSDTVYHDKLPSLEEWLNTPNDKYDSYRWERNFYPDPQEVLNDLHKKGLLEEGNYTIDIDW